MSLFCDAGYDHDGADWWWYQPADEAPLATKRSRKCCSCGTKVGVGDTALDIHADLTLAAFRREVAK